MLVNSGAIVDLNSVVCPERMSDWGSVVKVRLVRSRTGLYARVEAEK